MRALAEAYSVDERKNAPQSSLPPCPHPRRSTPAHSHQLRLSVPPHVSVPRAGGSKGAREIGRTRQPWPAMSVSEAKGYSARLHNPTLPISGWRCPPNNAQTPRPPQPPPSPAKRSPRTPPGPTRSQKLPAQHRKRGHPHGRSIHDVALNLLVRTVPLERRPSPEKPPCGRLLHAKLVERYFSLYPKPFLAPVARFYRSVFELF